jgi:hypothetical protein
MNVRTLGPVALAAAASLSSVSQAVTYTFSPSGTVTNTWSSGTNWSAVPVSAADTDLVFGSAGTLPAAVAITSGNDVANPFLLNSLTFNAAFGTGTNAYGITGSQLSFQADGSTGPTIDLSATGTNRPAFNIDNNVALGADLVINATSTPGSGAASTATILGVVSGNQNLTINGPGTVALSISVDHTFGGVGKTVTVQGGGTLLASGGGGSPNPNRALGGGGSSLVLGGGTFSFSPSNTPAAALSRNILLNAGTNGLRTAGSNGRSLAISGLVSGSGGFTTSGSTASVGLLNTGNTLGGTVTAAGDQTLFVLATGTAHSLGSANLSLAGQANGVLFGSSGSRSANVNLANYAGNVSIASGSTNRLGVSALNTMTFTGAFTGASSATLLINQGADQTALRDVINAGGTLNAFSGAAASSVVILDGDLSGLSSNLTLRAGTLRIGTGATLPTGFGALTVANGAGISAGTVDLTTRSVTVASAAVGTGGGTPVVGTLNFTLNANAGPRLTTSGNGNVALTNAALTFDGTGTLGKYTLVDPGGTGVISGTPTGTAPAGYRLASGSAEVALFSLAGIAASPTSTAVAASPTIIVGGSTGISGVVGNTAFAGGDGLDFAAALGVGSTSGTAAAGGTGAYSGLTYTGGAAGAQTVTVNFTGTNAATGAAVSPGSASTTVNVLASSNASFDPAVNQDALVIDIGTFVEGSGPQTAAFSIANLIAVAGFTAGLDLDSFALTTPDSASLSTDLAAFANLAAGSDLDFLATLSTTTIGSFSETYTLALSDQDLPGAVGGQTLTLTIGGEVVPIPEPGALALLAAAGLMVGRRRRA